MAITLISHSNVTNTTANSGSTSITVPGDAEIAILGVAGHRATTGFFSSTTPTLGGAGGTVVSTGGDAVGLRYKACLWYWINPSTGTQTLAWDWSGTLAAAAGVVFWVAYYKGINTSDPVRTTYGNQYTALNYVSSSLVAVTDDKIVSVAGTHSSVTPGSSWTNATDLAGYLSNGAGMRVAETDPTGDTTITYAGGDATDGALTCMVMKPAAAGGGGGTLATRKALLHVGL